MFPGFMKGKVVILCVLLTVTSGCFKGSVSVGVGNDRTLTGRGVKYIVPWENGSHTETPRGFEYKGESLTITEQAGQLAINGRPFGTVAPGDTVSFTNGVTFVNGQRRDALK
jgi:hypothetical protein